MCGIAGMIGLTDAGLLQRMTDQLSHRGPDDSGFFLSEAAALGHRRLSVIDIAGGRQPLSDETGHIQLVCNGEIYNYRELRALLEAKGHRFVSRSDSEVILHAYEDYGLECVHKFRGMFAFAIWDSHRRRLLLARDRLGIKPLYYTRTGTRFLFASEIKALLTDPEVKRRLNHSALHKYLAFRFVPAPETMFADIYKVEPGSMLTLSSGDVIRQKYWSASFAAAGLAGDNGSARDFAGMFDSSVAEHLASDRPLGVYLSGGLDSSYLAAVAAGKADALQTFSITFAGEAVNEGPQASRVAKYLGTDHIALEADPPDWQVLGKVAWHMDEPLGDMAAIPTYQLAGASKQTVSVALSGEGADELFAGYPQVRALARAWAWPRWAPTFPAAAVAGRYGRQARSRFVQQQQTVDQASAFLVAAAVFNPTDKLALLTADAWATTGAQDSTLAFLESQFPADNNHYDNLLTFYLRYWLADDLLLKNDKMTMAHGVEARVPYLDHRLVEYACGLPARARYRRRDKYLLRKAAARLLPRDVANRPKQGFTVPMGGWLKGELFENCKTLLLEGPSVSSGLFNRQAVCDILSSDLDDHMNRRAFATLLWLELWRTTFDC